MKFDERNKKKLKSPLFISIATAAKYIFGFHSSNFMKLCRNMHRSVWHLLGVEQIQNGSHCHGNQGAKNVKFTLSFTNFEV
jgi:hypothetical protein